MEYNGGLEKVIHRDSELLSEVDDAFCKFHPLLAQKVVTRSARAAVSKIGADALVEGRSTSSNSSSLYAATAARYIAAPLQFTPVGAFSTVLGTFDTIQYKKALGLNLTLIAQGVVHLLTTLQFDHP